jgi:hypothetical protein
VGTSSPAYPLEVRGSGFVLAGVSSSTVGRLSAVYGEITNNDGSGVGGRNYSAEGAGMGGEAYGSLGAGVAGFAMSYNGQNIGVYGETNSLSDGWGGYCKGNIGASGQKLFQIDHPLDPANKYLNHFCAEGPEALLIYRGNAILGDDGSVWVDLPGYFEAINRDFTYQLTPIGGPANLYIADEVKDNRFRIAGGAPGMKVSWEVTGARNDAYCRAYGKPVEEDKPPEQKGKYIHPELFGQPPEMGIHYREQPASAARAGNADAPVDSR